MSGEKTNTQTFSFETVAVLVAVLKDKGATLGMKDYELMASLDGTRSASGFDHLFRKVKGRANELLEAKGKGGAVSTPTKKGNGGSKNGTPATSETKSGKKRVRKPKKGGEGGDDESPTKKVKAEPEEDGPFAGGEEGDDEF